MPPVTYAILDQFGKPFRAERAKAPAPRQSKYDAAQTTDENKNHWANADGLSANAANSAWVRERLRNRSRYERANNGYAKGLIRARTNDTVGTGPRLQLDLPERYVDPDFQRTIATGGPGLTAADLARVVERKWRDWCEAVCLADKMRTLADAEDTDGEGFGLFTTNRSLPGVTLDIRVIEADRVTTPTMSVSANQVDGVVTDAAGNPTEYHVLRQHPGDTFLRTGAPWDFERVPAAQVVHLFDQDRPEQVRGLPLLTPALPLYAILRRYTLASLGAAELAAMIAGVIESEFPAGGGDEAPEFEAMDREPTYPPERTQVVMVANNTLRPIEQCELPDSMIAAFAIFFLNCERAERERAQAQVRDPDPDLVTSPEPVVAGA